MELLLATRQNFDFNSQLGNASAFPARQFISDYQNNVISDHFPVLSMESVLDSMKSGDYSMPLQNMVYPIPYTYQQQVVPGTPPYSPPMSPATVPDTPPYSPPMSPISQEVVASPVQVGPEQLVASSVVKEDETFLVNAKQYNRILKRREQRAKLEAQNIFPRAKRPYQHESRHRHAQNRVRGVGGRFVKAC